MNRLGAPKRHWRPIETQGVWRSPGGGWLWPAPREARHQYRPHWTYRLRRWLYNNPWTVWALIIAAALAIILPLAAREPANPCGPGYISEHVGEGRTNCLQIKTDNH